MNPCIAIIDANTLSSMSLRSILWDMYNHIEVLTYRNINDFIQDSNRHFIHFFVSADILFNNVDEFETLKKQTMVMITGEDAGNFEAAGFKTLNVSLPEKELAGKILHLHQLGHSGFYGNQDSRNKAEMKNALSVREKEVLELMVKGLINKEIAVRLNISVTTVIFHRNNICEKLHTRSIGKLTIYAVLHGIVDIKEL